MAKDLKVDPIDLRLSSDHMDTHHADLLAAHTAASEDIEAAQSGWVGSSATALQAKLAEWQETTTAITTDIAAHAKAFENAAHAYATVDADGAERLDEQL
ncbi:WXG100 family type VII secretion target [Mycobacterium sp. 2YAF39]